MPKILAITHLTASVGKKEILRDITLSLDTGKLYALMGPNGSGKSSLASCVMGHPAYTVNGKSRIIFCGKNITDLSPDKRARAGIFMTFQSPLFLSGVSIYQLLRFMLDKKKDPLKIRTLVNKYAQELGVREELLTRSLNDGFSGGEKKKMEVLQAVMGEAKLIFFDEIDTGVDVDALKTIALFLKKMKTKERTMVIITHYSRILKYLKPDMVLVMKEGKVVAQDGASLAEKIEKK